MVGYWRPSLIFRGETIFLLGGGPSLSLVQMDKLRGYKVIAINDAGYIAPWADALFFRDLKWFHLNRPMVDDWRGLVFTTNVKVKEEYSRVRCLEMKHMNEFSFVSLRYGRSSGHIALSLAITLGARRVILLGYDCRVVDGKSHFHDNIGTETAQNRFLYENDFLPAWKGWGLGCAQIGVEVLNATPGSAIKEFEFRPLDEILG